MADYGSDFHRSHWIGSNQELADWDKRVAIQNKMNKQQAFLKALKEFEDAAKSLTERWGEAEDADVTIPIALYPFKDSFDDIVVDIVRWREHVQNQTT